MADVKRDYDDDDTELKTIDVDGKIGASSSDESSSDEEEANEVMEIPETGLDDLPQLWLVKVPKSLMERWSKISDPNTTLAKIRVHKTPDRPGFHKISVHLPEQPQYDTTEETPVFNLTVPITEIANTYIFADKPKDGAAPGQKNIRSTRLVGRVRHKGSMKPFMSDVYASKVRHRMLAANKKSRMTARIDDKVATGGRVAGGSALADPDALKQGRSNLKMLASGAARNTSSIALQKKPTVAKKDTEHYARMPKNELIDKLVILFNEKPAWPLKELRHRVEQPVDYLKEVLRMIATLERHGKNNNQWVLNDAQKRMQGGAGPSDADDVVGGALSDMSLQDPGDADMDDDDDDDDDDEFSQMEEVE